MTPYLHAKLQEEMERSERIVLDGHEFVPRFRVIAPDGDYHILVPMPEDEWERISRITLVAAFMAWKLASAFIVSGESKVPDAFYSFAIARGVEPGGLLRPIWREPLELGSTITLGPEQCGEEFLQLLPGPSAKISEITLMEIKRVFGLGGEMEARRVN